MWTKLNLQPGIFKDDTPLAAEGYYTDCDNIRFERGKPQTRGGRESASDDTLTGICRGVHTWANATRQPYAAFGTHLRLYEMDVDGNATDITPVIEYGALSSAISTTLDSIVLTVQDASHGLVVDQLVTFSTTSTIAGLDPSGSYAVSSVQSSAIYTVNFTSSANATVSSGIALLDYKYHLAPGQVDGLGGFGYGTGGFGSGGYGASSSDLDLFPRTWSLCHYGSNLLANPRGGAIYEKKPGTTATELVTNGAFDSSASWTNGAGWTINGGNASALASNGTLSQSISIENGAWFLLDFDVTRAAGSLVAMLGTSTIGTAITGSATVKTEFWGGAAGSKDIKFVGSAFTGTVDNVSVKALTTAARVTAAPSSAIGVFITAEGIAVAIGCTNLNTGLFDPMRIQWSDRRDNLGITQWVPDLANLAGGRTLGIGSRFVAGRAANGYSLLWTDNALYRMTYTTDVNVVYRIDLVGVGCGLVGPNAIAHVSGVWYWMACSGEFLVYQDGGVPVALQSTVRRYMWDDLAFVQQDKICAHANTNWVEVEWLYPSQADGLNECSRYITFDPIDKCWTIGTRDFTAVVDAGIFEYPIAVDTTGRIFFNEKGANVDGSAMSFTLTAALLDAGDGDTHTLINGFRPDAEDLQGGYRIAFSTYWQDTRGRFSRTFGPYPITAATGEVSTRVEGQQIEIMWSGSDDPMFWRMGQDQFDMRQTTRRR